MYSQIYSGLSLIFAILRKFRVAGANSWAYEAGANEPIRARRAQINPLATAGQI